MVDRPQFTDEQRAFVVLKCEKYKASALERRSLWRQNCISKASPGGSHSGTKNTARTPENIEAVWVAVTADQTKDVFEDPTFFSHCRNDLGWVSHHQPTRELLNKTPSSTVTNCKVIKHFNSSFRTIFSPQKPWLQPSWLRWSKRPV